MGILSKYSCITSFLYLCTGVPQNTNKASAGHVWQRQRSVSKTSASVSRNQQPSPCVRKCQQSIVENA